jgi:hypothetical protein
LSAYSAALRHVQHLREREDAGVDEHAALAAAGAFHA